MLPKGPRESERILQGMCVAYKKKFLPSWAPGPGTVKAGPLQVAVGLEWTGERVEQRLAGDAVQGEHLLSTPCPPSWPQFTVTKVPLLSEDFFCGQLAFIVVPVSYTHLTLPTTT